MPRDEHPDAMGLWAGIPRARIDEKQSEAGRLTLGASSPPSSRSRAAGGAEAADAQGSEQTPADSHAVGGRLFVVRLPLPTSALSPNSRVDRWAKAREVRRYRQECWAEARRFWFLHGPPMQRATMALRFVFCGQRLRDPDNLAAGFKAGLDGLVDAKVLADDSARVIVETSVAVEPCDHAHRPASGGSYVEVMITEVQR